MCVCVRVRLIVRGVCGQCACARTRCAALCKRLGNIVVPLAAYTHSHPGPTCCSAWYTSWQYHMRAGCFTRYMVATCAPSASAKLSARRSQARCAAPVSCGVADKSARDSRISWAKLSGAASGMGQIFVWGTNACGELGGGFDPRVPPLLSHSSLPQPRPRPQPGGNDPMHHGYGRRRRECATSQSPSTDSRVTPLSSTSHAELRIPSQLAVRPSSSTTRATGMPQNAPALLLYDPCCMPPQSVRATGGPTSAHATDDTAATG